MTDITQNLRGVFGRYALPVALAVSAVAGLGGCDHNKPTAPPDPQQFLPEATTHSPVYDVQDFLIDQGYRHVRANDRMDINTASALIDFKERHGIKPATDHIAKNTLGILVAALAEKGSLIEDDFDPRVDELRIYASKEGQNYARQVFRTANKYIKAGIDFDIIMSVLKASQDSDVDFQYLMTIADAESSLVCDNEPTTSSAMGCFGVTDGMWKLAVDAGWGETYNFDMDSNRRDPYIGAVITAEMAKENYRLIRNEYDGPIGPPELKAGHFLGGNEAPHFMALVETAPASLAASLFPAAAAANHSMFYEDDRSVTVQELYETFERKMEKVPRYIENPPDIKMVIADSSTGKLRPPKTSS